MTLRQLVKQTKTRASQVYATVESAVLGKATVILVGSSQRITNLPVYGKEVSAGDTVVIDYSSEGIPYCRAPIQYQEDAALPTRVIVNEADVDPYDGFVACKVGLLSNRTFVDTVVGDTFTWTKIIFDDVKYDNRSLWNHTYGYCGELPTGQYMVNVNLGFYGVTGIFAVQVLYYDTSDYDIDPVPFRTPYSHDMGYGVNVINFTTLARISDPNEAIGIGFYCTAPTPQFLSAYSMFSIHKLKNLSPHNALAVRGYWDSGGTYF